MEKNKNHICTFEEIISHFYSKFNRIEASFSSKLAATIDPNLPVWDSYVLKNLGLKMPSYGSKNRLEKTINLYSVIQKWYSDFLQTEEAKSLVYLFDNEYENINITDVKKIDIILWQMR